MLPFYSNVGKKAQVADRPLLRYAAFQAICMVKPVILFHTYVGNDTVLCKPIAYDHILPLYGSHGRPVRCAPLEPQDPDLETGRRWYYDLTDDHRLSQDAESLLVWLCAECAASLSDQVQPAGTDCLHDGSCWQCGR